MNYTVDFVLHGHYDIDVEADNKDEAIESAEEIFNMTDFGMLWDLDGELYCVEDEDGDYEYFD